MTTPPTGAVTFLFTDVEGSTRLWEEHPEAMRVALQVHDATLRGAIEEHAGYVFSTAGDAFAAAFGSPVDAVAAAIGCQRRLVEAEWPETGQLKVRAGLHSGIAHERDGDYFGPPLNRCARLMAVGHGGQVLLSAAVAGAVSGALPPGCTLSDLGEHRLKDLEAPERIFQILDEDRSTEFPPIRSLGSYEHNLPEQTTSFVGRQQEIVEVAGRVRDARLVSLLGEGGAGKTRLSIQVGAEVIDRFPAGVWFVDLAPLRDGGLLAAAVAAVLGLDEETGHDAIAAHIGARDVLIILDNCEQIVDDAAAFVSRVLTSTAKPHFMVTSREPLGINGEHRYRVNPMPVPDPGPSAAQSDVVKLFAERASLVDPMFVLDDDTLGDIAEICRRLDGIPLAIELAAARTSVMSPRQIADKLEDRFRLLTTGSRVASPRQRTLEGAVDWSYDLLDAPDARLFVRLAVFAGAFDIDSAEAVCGFDELDAMAVLDGIGRLVERSLMRASPASSGPRTFRMLETLREYGAAKLAEAGLTPVLVERHIAFFAALTAEAHPAMRAGDTGWFERIEAAHPDIQAAISRAIASGDAASAARIAGKMWFFWYVRGYWDLGDRWLTRALAIVPDDIDPVIRADVLRGLGALGLARSNDAAGTAYLTEEVEVRRSIGDPGPLSAALTNLANAVSLSREYQRSIELYEEALEICRQTGEEQSTIVSNLGWTALDLGDVETAGERFAETVQLATAEGERRNEGWGHLGLGIVRWLQGAFADADREFAEGAVVFKEFGERANIAFCSLGRGKVARDRGDIEAARSFLSGARTLILEMNDVGGMGRLIVAMIGMAAVAEDWPAVARYAGAATDESDELPPWERVDVDRHLPTARDALTTEEFRSAFEAGRQTPRREIVEAMILSS